MGYILGLDIGVASVGYAIIDENYNVLISGVRLFREVQQRRMQGVEDSEVVVEVYGGVDIDQIG